jgi:pimeloyl-ACP methyl ester carboxylesterase
MGNDLVRFISLVIKRPVVTSGCSSGGVLSAWLSAFAMPGQVRGSHYEDPPLFASEVTPLYGHSIRQTAVGPSFEAFVKFLGDQWSIGDWKGMAASRAAAARSNAGAQRRGPSSPAGANAPGGGMMDGPPQNLKEYDPEWARAFIEGTVALGCPHERMLAQVKVPVLFTHHSRAIDPATGQLAGAISDLQASKVNEIVTAAGQPIEYVSLPDAAHAMHQADPARFAQVLTAWAKKLPA